MGGHAAMLTRPVRAVRGTSRIVRGRSAGVDGNFVAAHLRRLLALTILATGLSFSAWAYATMSCFVETGDASNAPAAGDTLCWADTELPKSPRDVELEMDPFYTCDPSWAGCTGFAEAAVGGAGAGGNLPGGFFFRIGVRFRETLQDRCCSAALYGFVYDANAKPLPPQSDMGKNAGPPSCSARAGDPVHVGTGNNYNRARDHLGAGPFALRFERHYNSILGVQSRCDGWRWKHTYERAVALDGSSAVLLRETGRAHRS